MINPTTLTAALEDALDHLALAVADINRANGWFDGERSVGDDIALLHSEVSEMFEAYRDHGLDDVTGETLRTYHGRIVAPAKPEGFGSECADVLIRLLDTCHRHGVNLAGEVMRKLAYNETRGYRHGGKRI